MEYLVDFVEKCSGFEDSDKIKLILFASGAKPSTFVPLKIFPSNLGDKFYFEKHLKEKGFLFSVDSPKSFEEISAVNNNKIIWSLAGTWYGYDLFKNRQYYDLFKKYIYFVRKRNHARADIIAGSLYGYPLCCIKNFIKEHDPEFVKNKYSYRDYFKKMHEVRKKFPFISHTPCSVNCAESKKLNSLYQKTIKKNAPKFYREFVKKKSDNADLIVESENNFKIGLDEENLWIEKQCHDYTLICKTPVNKHYYLFPYLSRDAYSRGSVLSAKITIQSNYASIKIKKLKKIIPYLMHIRKFKLLGRKY